MRRKSMTFTNCFSNFVETKKLVFGIFILELASTYKCLVIEYIGDIGLYFPRHLRWYKSSKFIGMHPTAITWLKEINLHTINLVKYFMLYVRHNSMRPIWSSKKKRLFTLILNKTFIGYIQCDNNMWQHSPSIFTGRSLHCQVENHVRTKFATPILYAIDNSKNYDIFSMYTWPLIVSFVYFFEIFGHPHFF
jgi:hypothetical protein